jgi:hypothetical protein
MLIGKPSKINYQAFNSYKNKYSGKSAVICGTGASLSNYKIIPNAIHLGLNRCLFYDKLIFDFYFFNDWSRTTDKYKEHILAYKPNIEKFFGCFPNKRSYGCSEKVAQDGNGTLYDMEGPGGGTYQVNIDQYRMGDGGMSTIFVLMQFALFAGFENIYIVGCDVDNLKSTDYNSRYFYNNEFVTNYHWYAPLKHNWKLMKIFIDTFYPQTNIISINPMGLKGLFKDEYQ